MGRILFDFHDGYPAGSNELVAGADLEVSGPLLVVGVTDEVGFEVTAAELQVLSQLSAVGITDPAGFEVAPDFLTIGGFVLAAASELLGFQVIVGRPGGNILPAPNSLSHVVTRYVRAVQSLHATAGLQASARARLQASGTISVGAGLSEVARTIMQLVTTMNLTPDMTTDALKVMAERVAYQARATIRERAQAIFVLTTRLQTRALVDGQQQRGPIVSQGVLEHTAGAEYEAQALAIYEEVVAMTVGATCQSEARILEVLDALALRFTGKRLQSPALTDEHL